MVELANMNDGSASDPPQSHDPFGHGVHKFLSVLPDAVKQMVQDDEGRVLDVPVSLFGLQFQVDQVGKPRYRR